MGMPLVILNVQSFFFFAAENEQRFIVISSAGSVRGKKLKIANFCVAGNALKQTSIFCKCHANLYARNLNS